MEVELASIPWGLAIHLQVRKVIWKLKMSTIMRWERCPRRSCLTLPLANHLFRNRLLNISSVAGRLLVGKRKKSIQFLVKGYAPFTWVSNPLV
ncbi:hypothetical protein LIER_26832 [Lithospermum erythrorhizon]|uniref:Uncharacterized protein n=1 Tax=Lithospermum erythrorhizon TaxID=34254 RepID=A0AAV3R9T2_LITER